MGAKSIVPLAGIVVMTLATVAGTAPDPVRGREVFLANCAVCHGDWADGDGPAAAALGLDAPDLTRIAERRGGHFPYDDVRGIIEGRRQVAQHGPRGMPVWGEVFEAAAGGLRAEDVAWARIEALVAYLESIQVDPEADGADEGPGAEEPATGR